MATRTIKSAAGKSSLSITAVRTAARKASAVLRDGRSSAQGTSRASSALSQRSATKSARSGATDAGRRKRK